MSNAEAFAKGLALAKISAFAWPERPPVGSDVQLIAGSQKFKIIRFEGDIAVVRNANGDLLDFHYRVLRPWRVH